MLTSSHISCIRNFVKSGLNLYLKNKINLNMHHIVITEILKKLTGSSYELGSAKGKVPYIKIRNFISPF